MGLIGQWLAPSLETMSAPDDERLWSGGTANVWAGGAGMSVAGSLVSESSALTVSTVYRCCSLLGWTVGSLPIDVMRWTDQRTQTGVERAPDHPLSYVLKVAPNRFQTSFSWRATLIGSVVLRGNAYQRIVPGRRGFADQLMPVHYDRTYPEYLSGSTWVPAQTALLTPGGRMRYQITPDAGASPEVLLDEEVFHLRGYSTNGLMGVGVLEAMRNAVGLTQALETFKSRLYAQGTRLSGVLKYPGTLKPDALDRLKESWKTAYSGAWNAGKVPVLEHGMDFQAIGMDATDAQLLEAGVFQVEDLLRFLGVPGVLVGHPDKSATYASAEQFFLSFAKHSVEHWLVNLEAELQKELILADDRYFIRIDRNPLVRGDLLNRWNAHKVARDTGAKTIEEIRQEEGLNPLPADAAAPLRVADPRVGAWMAGIVDSTAGRLVRKEIAAITQAAPRFAADVPGWGVWLEGFYAKHADLIVDALHVPAAVAAEFVGRRRAELLASGVAVVRTWADRGGEELAAAAWAFGAAGETQ